MIPVAALIALVITAQPLVDEDVLEPSVQNEVDHALSLAPTNLPVAAAVPASCACRAQAAATNLVTDVFATNGLSATQIAIRLISSQKSDGRWYAGTNDVTAAAVEILKSL